MDEKANINEESNALLSDSDSSRGSNSKSFSPLQTIFGIASAFMVVPTMVTSTVCVQLLERHIPDFELNMFRYSVLLLGTTATWVLKADWPVVPASEIPGLVAYIILGIIYAMSDFTAATFMPIATVKCVAMTSAIFSGFILFSVFGEEKVKVKTFLCIAICITGIVMIIQPGFSSHSHPLTALANTSTTYNRSTTILCHPDIGNNSDVLGHDSTAEPLEKRDRIFLQDTFGYLLSVITGIALSSDFLVLKRNTFLTENKLITIFWSCCIGTLVSAAMMAVLEHPVFPSNWFEVFLVMSHSIGYAVLWLLFMVAVQYISGNTLNMIVCICPVVMLIPQYTVLSSLYPGHKNWIEVVGVVLVLIGSITGSVVEMYESKTERT